MSEPQRRARIGAREAYWLALAAVFGLILAWNLPGHLTVDSVLALNEGRSGVRQTWNPAIYSWLLGVLDRVSPGAGLYMGLFALLLVASWAALALLRPRVSWAAPVVVAAVALTPQVLIYQGIVWKDVSFANAAVGGFVALALALRSPTAAGRRGWLAAAALLLAAAGLLRQNGLILVPPAALALAWARAPQGWLRSVAGAAGWTALVAVFAAFLGVVAQPQGIGPPDTAGARGVKVLELYDIVAVVAENPATPLTAIRRARPAVDDYLRREIVPRYTPERVDTLDIDPDLVRGLRRGGRPVLQQQWEDLVFHHTGEYLHARAEAFKWVFATPVIDRCLPIHIGVEGPPATLQSLKLAPRKDRRDQRLYNYATWFFDTPVMSHVAYAALALGLMAGLLIRREPADLAIAALLAGALAAAASFFVISIACDYRYLYFLDLAAITALIYVAIDPRLRRRA